MVSLRVLIHLILLPNGGDDLQADCSWHQHGILRKPPGFSCQVHSVVLPLGVFKKLSGRLNVINGNSRLSPNL
jgi:hypothetical protein